MESSDNMISNAQADALWEEAAAAERLGRLTDLQLDIIHESGWFKMFLPKEVGGLGFGLPEGLRLEEELARIDGSLGWTVTLCSGATMFAGFMDAALRDELLAEPSACFGGSGAVHGIAEQVGDGYVINGHWRYATGAPHLRAFTANCQIYDNGMAMTDDQDEVLVRAFVFKASEVQVSEDWNSMGLRATAGHSFSVQGLSVPMTRAFDILPEAAQLADAIFRFPFWPFAETTLAVNSLGIAQHFLDCCVPLFEQKSDSKRAAYLQALQYGNARLQQLRSAFYEVAEQSWEIVIAGGQLDNVHLEAITKRSRELVWGSRAIVTELIPYCGMAATHPDGEINRVFRDLYTASQHSLLNSL